MKLTLSLFLLSAPAHAIDLQGVIDDAYPVNTKQVHVSPEFISGLGIHAAGMVMGVALRDASTHFNTVVDTKNLDARIAHQLASEEANMKFGPQFDDPREAVVYYQERRDELKGSELVRDRAKVMRQEHRTGVRFRRAGNTLMLFSVADILGRILADQAFDREASIVPVASLSYGLYKEVSKDLGIPYLGLIRPDAQ